MALNHMKICAALLLIREMQSENSQGYLLQPYLGTAKNQKTQNMPY